MALKISDEAKVQMPMKTVASLIALVAIGTWAYFGIIETQNRLQTEVELMSKDLVKIQNLESNGRGVNLVRFLQIASNLCL